MENIELIAKKRKKTGTKYSKKIRRNNEIPSIIYGKKKKNILIKIKHNSIYNIIKKHQKKQKINKLMFLINIKNKKIKSKIKHIQKHPYKNKILHIDFIFNKN